ncbi:NAD(P)H-quinone oxidoreductase subunit 5 [Microcella alkaliphila]|uniref:NAD(P)H-quinone oxidoreductase subunit 5 n=1 Tax=Microcella alkaliphila TaxID=279828 RepID=A0A4Q7TR67_9MICO|nr:proton-conducting transporter membrane subunit [Microcella alkaliphila]RZT62318.1 NAD(P)H-quinone oxidoreductase subunit 5 [Microcella alkaliphila]
MVPDLSLTELLRLDAATLLLLALVLLVALAVLPYAHRSLRGDRHGASVTAALALVFVASAALVVLAPLPAQAIAWSTATLGVIVALRLGGGTSAARRPATWLVASDVLVWAAVIVGPGTAAAILLVGAAIIRAAGVPAHGWLLDALRAPTPVSAALHGGVVNGGAILLILQLPAMNAGAAPLIVAAAFGALAIVVGGAGLAARPDIKGKLVLSTVAQLGFTLLCIGLGLTVAALLHLVAHGWYKSSRFLSSGDGVDRRARERRSPAAHRRVLPRAGTPLGATVAAAAVVAGVLVAYPGAVSLGGAVITLMIGLALAAAAGRLVAHAVTTGEALTRLTASATLSFAAALALGSLTRMLGPALGAPLATPAASVALALAAALAVLLLAVLRRTAAGASYERAALAAALALGAAPRTPAARTRARAAALPAAASSTTQPTTHRQEVAA